MKKIFVLLFCLALGYSQVVFAGWNGSGSTELTIDYIEVGQSAITVYFNEPVYNPASCSMNLNTVSWEDTEPPANKFLTMMTTAKASGRKVRVLVDETTCLWGGWKKLKQMQLK